MPDNPFHAPDLKNSIVCVVGAGFVGLPLSEAFAKKIKVITYEIDPVKVKRLTENKKHPNQEFTADPKAISQADFICICVPTPLTNAKEPDMSYVKEAARTVGQHLKKNSVVILESSVYPGVTEELVKPEIEQASGFKFGTDFKLAYSPERINPGDAAHSVDKVTKIVSASDEETLDLVANLYSLIAPDIYKAKDIRTAETAKIVENIQRDLNIALVNEFAIMFEKMGLSTKDVLEAAATKWNFQSYTPGMVGGYCIPVVPYFLIHKAEEVGYHPQVIMAGRAINDSMPKYIAEMAVKSLNTVGKVIKGSKVLIMGLSYKENVFDVRQTPVKDLIKELREYSIEVWGYTPFSEYDGKELEIKFSNNLDTFPVLDCIIVTQANELFKNISLAKLRSLMNSHPILIDVRGIYDSPEVHKNGFMYKRL